MWALVQEIAGGQSYRFLTDTSYVVGRKNCTILVEDDQSISRIHATFTVSHSLSNLGRPDVIPVLTIKDSSKYGTFINGEKMENASPRNLKSGDKVTFGVYNSKYRVTYEPLVACSSCLDASEKNALSQAVLGLGGHVVNNWTEKCTHLVMTSLKVTIKTICAFICCRSIIIPEYFREMIKSIQRKQSLPALSSFMPIIDEPSLQSETLDLSENAKRKTIFKDKTFLFLAAKQHKKLSPAIQFGHGKAQQLTGELDDQSLLEDPNTCVIDLGMTESQLSESQCIPTWITSTMDVLKSNGLRTIPEAEIGLAVIYMSTETYCNPLQRTGNRNVTETSTRNNIMESSHSLSMAVDETVLPAATFNTTAYVADTEPQDPTDNCMAMSGVREVKETPGSLRRSNKPSMVAEQDLEAGIGSDCRTVLFPEHPTPAEERTRQVSQTEKARVSQKMPPSNKIQNYFQPMAKKRDRDEDESEASSSTKLARVGNRTSLCPKPVVDGVRQSSNAVDADVDIEPVVLSSKKPEISHSLPKSDVGASGIRLAKEASVKKRKEPENVVEESDIENEEESADEMHQKNPKNNINKAKRPRLVSEDDFGDLETDSQDRGDRTAPPPQKAQKVKTESDSEQEPEPQYERTKMTVKPKDEDDDEHPSKVLVLEFRSLVVNRPARNSQLTANSNNGNGPNFKKFRKIAYPGAGSFPHIIGGSDLIAHDKKKNSELEQWLRQEMEEQTQQAREQSLAEDLFRYNPKTVKKRR